jgi:hypothetical protein
LNIKRQQPEIALSPKPPSHAQKRESQTNQEGKKKILTPQTPQPRRRQPSHDAARRIPPAAPPQPIDRILHAEEQAHPQRQRRALAHAFAQARARRVVPFALVVHVPRHVGRGQAVRVLGAEAQRRRARAVRVAQEQPAREGRAGGQVEARGERQREPVRRRGGEDGRWLRISRCVAGWGGGGLGVCCHGLVCEGGGVGRNWRVECFGDT